MSTGMNPIEISIAAALIAVLYAVVLASEDTPLNRWFRWLERMREAGGWRSWIASPLGACEKCVAGQLALWSSILINGGHDPASILWHLAAASGAVLSAPFIAHAYRWMQRRI